MLMIQMFYFKCEFGDLTSMSDFVFYAIAGTLKFCF